MLILGAYPLLQIEQRAEAGFQGRIAINLAADVADDPAKPRPQELELAPGALELMSVGIAADHDGGALRQAQIALAQRHTVALGEPDELGDGPMYQPRVRRMRNGLWLHRGIDRHSRQVLGTDGASLVRHRQTFLDQRDELLLAEPLPQARHRRSIDRHPRAEAN